MGRYHTTNLRFEEADYQELQYRARNRGVTVAEIVREAVSLYLGRAEDGPELVNDPADSMVGCVAESHGDESVNHDRYLYGWTKGGELETPGRHERNRGSGHAQRPEPSESSEFPPE